MSQPPRSPARAGRPPRTSRAEVLAAAGRILEHEGWEKLTVRRLAGEIGVSTMTIYHHVKDRGDLLVQLISDRLDRLEHPAAPDSPRERILVAATFMHDALAEWPWVTEVVTTDGFLSRLSDASLWPVETIVSSALEAGCTADQAILVFRNVWYFTVGEILVRAHTRQRRSEAAGDEGDALFGAADPAIASRDADVLPSLVRVGPLWSEVAQRDTFAHGLEAVVDGLLAQAVGDADHRG